tara:strand:+ start:128 stop:367 length:240 start_codon:yes stop_codon:yes gene_type:complete
MIPFTYKNKSSKLLVIRCIGSNNFFLEKVIFPFEDFFFLAPHGSKIEILGNDIDGMGMHIEERIRLPLFEYEDNKYLAA